MKKIGFCATVAVLMASSPTIAQSGTESPTATHDNPSSCLGAERATKNSSGGERNGEFGQIQSEYIAYLKAGGTKSYGQWLKEWKGYC